MTKNHQELVRDFMVIMEQFNPSNPNVDVTNLTEEDVDTAKLRLNLIVEELDEMFEAFLTSAKYKYTFSPLFSTIQSYIAHLEKDDFEEVVCEVVSNNYVKLYNMAKKVKRVITEEISKRREDYAKSKAK